MLQTMRDNAQSWVAKVIVGVIVLIFALTGWESISRFTSDAETAAEVNGQAISKLELEQAVALADDGDLPQIARARQTLQGL